jgi:hypothetical protein
MQRPILFIVLLFVAIRPAFAVNWVETVKGVNRSTSYIDTDSIRRDGHKVTVWSRHMLYEPLPLPGASGSFTEMRIRQTIDCQARTSAHSIVRLYDKGKQVMSETASPPTAKPIIPGGIADKTRQSVCTSAKSGQRR